MSIAATQTEVPLLGFVGEILERLGDAVIEVEQCEPRRGIARIDPARTVEVARTMLAMEGARLATATGIDVRDGIDVLYHWAIELPPKAGDRTGTGVVVTLKVLAARPALAVESIANAVPAADWIEREIMNLLGATFRHHPDPRRLNLDDSWPDGVYPLRKDFDQIADRPPLPPNQPPPDQPPDVREDIVRHRREQILHPDKKMVMIGPFHPLQEEAEFYQLYVDGETVVDVDVRISYNHRGIEKLDESKTFDQVPFVVERVCGICSASHPLAYIQAVEDIAHVEVPERALYLRTIVNELERIHSHMLWAGLAGHFLGYNTVFMWAWKYREPTMDILEVATGSRVNYANCKIGGVRRDMTDEQLREIDRVVTELQGPMEMLTNAVLDDPILHARLKNVGVLTPEDAKAYGATGPTARGSGVPIDVRRDDPYAVYNRVDWEVVTTDTCDVFGKAVVRLLEVFEAIKIIKQCCSYLRKNPGGEIDAKVPAIPPGEAVGHVEAPRGETFHYVRSDGSNRPVRHKIRAPSFVNIPTFKVTCPGTQIPDVAIALAAVDPCYSCTERMCRVVDAANPARAYSFRELVNRSQEKTRRMRKEG